MNDRTAAPHVVRWNSLVAILSAAALLLVGMPTWATEDLEAQGGSFVSDDFSGGLDPSLWSVVDAVGDGSVGVVGVGSSGARLELGVPAGVSHDPWNTNRSLRVMQSVVDEDVEVEARFDSVPSARYQMQGLLFEQDAGNWLRFEFHHTGSGLRVFAASTVAGKSTGQVNRSISTSAPSLWLRVARQGSTWTMRWSDDGESFSTAGSFTRSLSVSSVGPFAGNHQTPESASPAFTARVNHVVDTAAPVGPDPDPEPDPVMYGLSTSVVGQGSVSSSPAGSEFEAGTQVELSAVPADGWLFAGWSGDVSGSDSPVTVVMDDDRSVTATFTEQEVAEGPEIALWYGDTQRTGHLGTPTPWTNVLGRITGPEGVASASFRVNDGPERALSLGPNNRRLQATGDFNVEIRTTDLQAGSNIVTIKATGNNGGTSTREVEVERVTGITAPFPVSVSWGSGSSLLETAQVADGNWRLEGDGVRTTDLGYDRLLVLGETSWQNYQVTSEVTVHGLGTEWGTPESGYPLVGYILRWPGHTNLSGEQPSGGFFPVGAFAWHLFRSTSGRFEIVAQDWRPRDSRNEDMAIGQTYVFKAQVQDVADGHTTYRFRYWKKGDPEPTTWQNTLTYDHGAPQGSVGLVAHHVDATFGDVEITPIP